MTSSELQVVDEGRETVVFWDGCEWTREELNALRPGLFEFVQQHPRLTESPPCSIPRELLLWFVFSAIGVVMVASRMRAHGG